MRVINDYIVIQRINTAEKVAGLELTGSQNENNRYGKGKVLAVNPSIEELVKVGDVVVYSKGAAFSIHLDGKEQTVIRTRDVIALED